MPNHDALESALQKIAGLELSDDEVNALAEALGSDDEVEGFAMSPKAGRGWIILDSIIPETPIPKGLIGDDFGIQRMKESGEKGGPPRR